MFWTLDPSSPWPLTPGCTSFPCLVWCDLSIWFVSSPGLLDPSLLTLACLTVLSSCLPSCPCVGCLIVYELDWCSDIPLSISSQYTWFEILSCIWVQFLVPVWQLVGECETIPFYQFSLKIVSVLLILTCYGQHCLFPLDITLSISYWHNINWPFQ